MASRGTHDLGGAPAGPVHRAEHDLTYSERCIDAILMLLIDPRRNVVRVDELRRAIEELPPSDYETLSYYERWIIAIRSLLVEKGVVSAEEIERKVAEFRRRVDRV